MTDPVQFALAVLLLLAAPGPTNTMMALAGALNRDQRPVLFVLASMAGISPSCCWRGWPCCR
jgi:threonine/homoserine/homoserine lactone efflux protein